MTSFNKSGASGVVTGKFQHGVSISGLMLVSVVLVFIAIFAMKVLPSTMEYFTILKTVKSIVGSELPPGATVADVRKAFNLHSQVDNITSVTAAELDVSKDGNEIIIGFAYAKKIPLFGPVSLYIDYEGSSSAKGN